MLSTAENNMTGKGTGTVITILVHALLLLLFFNINFKTPPPAEPMIEGVIVNLGNADDGSGDVQPLRTGDFASESSTPTTSGGSPSAASQATASGFFTQEEIRTTGVTSSSTPTEFQTQTATTASSPNTASNAAVSTSSSTATTASTSPQVNPNALFRARDHNGPGGNNSSTNNTSTSQGDGHGSGDKGALNGDPNATEYGDWSSDGSGVPLKMKNRKFVQKPVIVDNSQETGTVILKIKVNKSGQVLTADFYPKGSTTSNTDLINKAKKAVKESYLNEGNLPEQIGLVKIVFKYKS